MKKIIMPLIALLVIAAGLLAFFLLRDSENPVTDNLPAGQSPVLDEYLVMSSPEETAYTGSNYEDLSSEISKFKDLQTGTISLWFKFESVLGSQTIMPILYFGEAEGEGNDNIFVIEIGHGAESTEGITPLPDSSNKKLYVTWIKNKMEPFLCFDSNVNLEENKWYHLVVVISDSGNTGYLDGVEMTNRHYNFGSATDSSFFADIPSENMFVLGYGKSSSMLSPEFVYFKGSMKDLKIYSKPLALSEIASA